MIDTSNNLSQLQAQSLQLRDDSVSVRHAKRNRKAERMPPEASPAGPGRAQSRDPGAERANQNVVRTWPPIVEPQQALQATQHASVLIQAQARAALLAQANASSQSVQRLLS